MTKTIQKINKRIIVLFTILAILIILIIIAFNTSLIDFSPKYNLTASKVIIQMKSYGLSIIEIKPVRASNNIFNNQYTSKVEFSNNIAYITCKSTYDALTEDIQNIKNSAEYKSYPPFPKPTSSASQSYVNVENYYKNYPLSQQLLAYENALPAADANMQNAPTYSGIVEVFRNSRDCNKRKAYLNSITYSGKKPIICTAENILLNFDPRFPDEIKYIDIFNRLYNKTY
jgi:hypothetical protein